MPEASQEVGHVDDAGDHHDKACGWSDVDVARLSEVVDYLVDLEDACQPEETEGAEEAQHAKGARVYEDFNEFDRKRRGHIDPEPTARVPRCNALLIR